MTPIDLQAQQVADSTRVVHLRARDGAEQPTTALELFFDLVYVFAVTQLSHLLLGHLNAAGAGRTLFLLFVIWWAWIYTTWMVNWFDPESILVRIVLIAVMLASLLMAAALPQAFTSHGLLFAGAYVALQVGRNAAGALLLPSEHPLRRAFERIVTWSVASGGLWLAGGLLSGDGRLLVWIPALLIDLAAPFAGYWVPGLGRSTTDDYDIHGGHFAERCQGFIIIALGESIVLTGASAADAGLTTTVVLALSVAFLGTGALWWLYFGEVAAHSRRSISGSTEAARLARDAYTYLHLPIVAGIIAVAVGDDLLIAHPSRSLSHAGAAVLLGGPLLYLLGEALFRWRMIRSVNNKRLLAMAALAALAPLSPHVSALALSAIVGGLLTALALWEFSTGGVGATSRRPSKPAIDQSDIQPNGAGHGS